MRDMEAVCAAGVPLIGINLAVGISLALPGLASDVATGSDFI